MNTHRRTVCPQPVTDVDDPYCSPECADIVARVAELAHVPTPSTRMATAQARVQFAFPWLDARAIPTTAHVEESRADVP